MSTIGLFLLDNWIVFNNMLGLRVDILIMVIFLLSSNCSLDITIVYTKLRVKRHRVKRHRVKRQRVKLQTVKKATKRVKRQRVKMEKHILCIISGLG